MGKLRDFFKFDPYKAKIHHAQMMVTCALCDTTQPFENSLMVAFKSKLQGGITVTIQRDGKKSPAEQREEYQREIAALHDSLDAKQVALDKAESIVASRGTEIDGLVDEFATCVEELAKAHDLIWDIVTWANGGDDETVYVGMYEWDKLRERAEAMTKGEKCEQSSL